MATRRTKDAQILVDTASDPDPSLATDPTSNLGRIRSIDHNKEREDIEHDEVGDDSRRRTKGLADFQLSVELTVDMSDPGQTVLRDAILAADDVIVHYLYDGTNGWEQVCAVSSQSGGIAGGELRTDTVELQAATGYLWNAV